jgi:hypothetical protein
VRRAFAAAATAVVVLIVLAAAVLYGVGSGLIELELPTRTVGPPLCEGLTSTGRDFKAHTGGQPYTAVTEANDGRGVVYRRAANTNSDFDVKGRLLPTNCQVGFSGFCIGEALQDLSLPSGPLDQTWFKLPGGRGYVHGGVVQELPPGTIGRAPIECPGGRDEPRIINATDLPKRAVGVVTLRFDAPAAVTVGAAAYAAIGSSPQWVQLGLDTTAVDGFGIVWHSEFLNRPQSGVTVVYSVCWAGNVPGRAHGTARVDVDAPPGGRAAPAPSAAPAPPRDLRQGYATACKSVSGGS